MCGINAYWETLSPAEGTQLLRHMNAKVAHRGPDGEGFWTGYNVGLAHRRLSIIDLDGGAQPMECCAGRYIIAFNGEIYNYRQLRAELRPVGYVFQTSSDTEVIPATIDHYGIQEGLNRLQGMFAFVLYDRRQHELLLARDYVGIKPLYLVPTTANGWLVCSELKSAMSSGEVSGRIHGGSILDYLRTGHIPAPRSAWRDVEEIRPGSWVQLSRNGMQRGCFWRWQANPEARGLSQTLDQTEQTLQESVRAHLVSDVPVATFLSGGVDSSLITAIVSRHFRPSISSYNVGFDEAVYDESPYARRVAEHCGTNHHEITVTAGQATPELLEKVVSMYDQPFGDSSCLPTYLVCQAVSQHCKVILSGDGGDEMFGGYARYGQADLLMSLSRVPLAPWALARAGRIAASLRPNLGRRLWKAGRAASRSRVDLALELITYFSEEEIQKLLLPEVWKAWTRDEGFTDVSDYFTSDREPLSAQLINFEINTLLHADYLRKVDIASMANSLEVRTPFLDRKVFGLAQSIPVHHHVSRRQQKRLLKRLAARFVPRETIYRRKQGFGIPFDRWVDNPAMQEYLRDLLTSPDARNRSICQPRMVETLLSTFLSRSRLPNLSRYQVYQRVFMLLSLELWLRRWQPSLN